MTIQEILEAHLSWYFPDGSSDETRCLCGHLIAVGEGAQKLGMAEKASFTHVAEVLEQHMQEREAAVIESLADELGDYRNGHDIAECAAPVEGETGRQGCIDRWIEITEDPEAWLRDKSAEHHKNGFEYIRRIAYEAWQTGFESGWDEAKDPSVFVNDVWDAKTPNPYTDEEASNGR